MTKRHGGGNDRVLGPTSGGKLAIVGFSCERARTRSAGWKGWKRMILEGRSRRVELEMALRR